MPGLADIAYSSDPDEWFALLRTPAYGVCYGRPMRMSLQPELRAHQMLQGPGVA